MDGVEGKASVAVGVEATVGAVRVDEAEVWVGDGVSGVALVPVAKALVGVWLTASGESVGFVDEHDAN